jgi:hypothetical protein
MAACRPGRQARHHSTRHSTNFPHTSSPLQVYKDRISKFLNNWMTGKGVLYTPKGLAMMPPNGTLQFTANAAMLALIYSKGHPNALDYNCWSLSQLNYMLGATTGQSFIVGYGPSAPTRVPHRAASCVASPDAPVCDWRAYENPGPNPNMLYGALVGGPDVQDRWYDIRDRDSGMNKVSLLNNAGFTAAIAGLIDLDVTSNKCSESNGLVGSTWKKAQGLRY